MAKTRLELHEYLCEILNSRNVYFRAPESNQMKYPAIKYDLAQINNRHANNSPYMQSRAYTLTLIDYDPDSKFVELLSIKPFCTFDRSYIADGLNHWVFTLYY